MFPLIINGKAYQFKSKWEELTNEEILKVCFTLSDSLHSIDPISSYAIRIQLFSIITDVPQKIVLNITSVQWADILPHMNWLFDHFQMKTNHFPTIRLGWQKLYGPINGDMKTSSALEMITADTFFMLLAKKQDPQFLFKLAATLYRKKKWFCFFRQFHYKWEGDKRQELNEIDIERRAKKMQKKFGKDLATYIFLYYRSFRKYELMRFKPIFEGGGKGKKKALDFGWHGTLLEFSGKSLGDYEKTAAVNWKVFCMQITNEIQASTREE